MTGNNRTVLRQEAKYKRNTTSKIYYAVDCWFREWKMATKGLLPCHNKCSTLFRKITKGEAVVLPAWQGPARVPALPKRLAAPSKECNRSIAEVSLRWVEQLGVSQSPLGLTLLSLPARRRVRIQHPRTSIYVLLFVELSQLWRLNFLDSPWFNFLGYSIKKS